MSGPLREDRRARAAMAVALGGLVGVVLASLVRWPRLPDNAGLAIGSGGWFVDWHAVLAAAEAHARGLDIHRYNPLDVYGRPHSYSSWWLVLANLGLARGDTGWMGALLVTAFVGVAAWMARAVTWRQFAFAALVLVSPALLLSLVRANNDLVVFLVLAPVVPLATCASPIARLAVAAVIAVAAGLKYYPAAAALLLLHDDNPRLVVWRGVLAAALFAAVALSVYPDSLHFAQTLPAPNALFSLGAPGVFSALQLPPSARWIVAAIVVGVTLVLSSRATPSAVTRDDLQFVLGAVLIAACFWVTTNWAYRWVFSVWLLPVLLAAPREASLVSHWQWRALRVLLPLCLWWDGLWSLFWNLGPGRRLGVSLERYGEIGWLLIQPLQWAVAILLTSVCARFAFVALRRLPLGGPAASATTA